jgi:hypothetical protein
MGMHEEEDNRVYATPHTIKSLDECSFYHTMDNPNVTGLWDLRAGVKKYLGHVDFQGKRVLDIGTASGFLAFWIERQGAREVIGFDLSDEFDWDSVPGDSHSDPGEPTKEGMRKMNNSFWYTRALLGSNAKMVYGTVYDIPEAIGPIDISVFGSLLIHLRDPFFALQNALNLTTETVIIANPFSLGSIPLHILSFIKPVAAFIPSSRNKSVRYGWWSLSPKTVIEFLRLLGFPNTNVIYHTQRYMGKRQFVYTVVGKRDKKSKTGK